MLFLCVLALMAVRLVLLSRPPVGPQAVIGTADLSPAPPCPRSTSGTAVTPSSSPNSQPGNWFSQLLSQLGVLDAETDGVQRQEGVDRLVDSIPYAEIQSVLNVVEGASGDAASEFKASLVRRWAEKAPAEAAAWALQLRETPLAGIVQKEVALAWAESDLLSALTWARQIPDGDLRETVLTALGYEAARENPVQALEIGLALKPGNDRQELLIHSASQWAALDPEAARRWVLSRERTEDGGRLVAGIAVASAELAPEFSLRLAANELPAGELQNTAVISIIQRWAQRNPEAAAAWVGQFQAEPLGRIAVRNLVDVWSESSWDGPAQWLVDLVNPDLRDAGLSLLARKLAVVDRANATEWARMIATPGLRESTQLAILEMARGVDPSNLVH